MDRHLHLSYYFTQSSPSICSSFVLALRFSFCCWHGQMPTIVGTILALILELWHIRARTLTMVAFFIHLLWSRVIVFEMKMASFCSKMGRFQIVLLLLPYVEWPSHWRRIWSGGAACTDCFEQAGASEDIDGMIYTGSWRPLNYIKCSCPTESGETKAASIERGMWKHEIFVFY